VVVVILFLTMIIMVESEYCPRLASCPGCLYAASSTLAPVNTHYVMYVTVEVSDVVSGKTEVLITKVNFSTVLLQSAHCVCDVVIVICNCNDCILNVITSSLICTRD